MTTTVKMVAHSVGVGNDRAVAALRAVPDPDDEAAAGGNANIVINDPDALDDFEEGATYTVSFAKAAPARGAAASDPVQAARAIPNSTNTRGYKTPASLKVPPPVVPDGVVTSPRPSVVLEPAEAPAPAPAPAPAAPATQAPPAQPAKK
jgi:hypothetical protein